MKKYKVEFVQSETFIVDVYAKSEEDAQEKAYKLWEEGHYQEIGDVNVELETVYDVTDTDDPFYPVKN